jgi:hypothetical protein
MSRKPPDASIAFITKCAIRPISIRVRMDVADQPVPEHCADAWVCFVLQKIVRGFQFGFPGAGCDSFEM